jgi:anti-sigma regulatory factor (Ser/Thr protein kinase)
MIQEFTFASDFHELRCLRERIKEFCCGIGDLQQRSEFIDAIIMGVNEAASNVMEHAYGCLPDGWIQAQFAAVERRIEITLTHAGSGFDREQVAPPSFDGSRDGGFGVFIMEHIFDAVAYEELDNGAHRIRMQKSFDSPGL